MLALLLSVALAGDTCPAGQVLISDDGGQCCWPGQVWDADVGVCAGPPVCPEGYHALQNTCANPEVSATLGLDVAQTPAPSPAADSDEPSATVGSPIMLGALAKESIDAVITESVPKLNRCYATALKEQPYLTGKDVVKFVIDKDGTVANAMTKSSTLNAPELEACVLKVVYEMTFPEPETGGIVLVSYPFVFG